MLTDNLFVALAALLADAPSFPGRYFIAIGAREEAWDQAAPGEARDLDGVTPKCQIDEIRFDRRHYFPSVEAAAEAGYDVCAYCFGRERSQR